MTVEVMFSCLQMQMPRARHMPGLPQAETVE